MILGNSKPRKPKSLDEHFESNLAVLKVDREGLTALKFMNSDRLRQGDLVLALGAPMGLPNSMSLGIVSAPARSLGEQNPMVYVTNRRFDQSRK